MSTIPTTIPTSNIGDPPWEIATLFPAQGQWSAQEYLDLKGNRLVEFNRGRIEVLPMPTESHQAIVFYLCQLLHGFLSGGNQGKALPAPLRVKLGGDVIREPDVVVMLAEHDRRRHEEYWDGADLVVEVISPSDPQRDLETKRAEYAAAGIPEYWIADPRDQTLTVLTLPAGQSEYAEAGRYTRGQQAASVLLPGLQVDVAEVFSQA